MTDTADPPSPRSRVVTWHDPHEIVAGLAGRNGLEFIQALASGELPAAPILATIGDVRIVSATKGEVVLELEPAEYQYNPIGSVHGGAYATILDSACGCVVQTMLPEGVGYTSLDLSVKFIAPRDSHEQLPHHHALMAQGCRLSPGGGGRPRASGRHGRSAARRRG